MSREPASLPKDGGPGILPAPAFTGVCMEKRGSRRRGLRRLAPRRSLDPNAYAVAIEQPGVTRRKDLERGGRVDGCPSRQERPRIPAIRTGVRGYPTTPRENLVRPLLRLAAVAAVADVQRRNGILQRGGRGKADRAAIVAERGRSRGRGRDQPKGDRAGAEEEPAKRPTSPRPERHAADTLDRHAPSGQARSTAAPRPAQPCSGWAVESAGNPPTSR
jgi:hypothetical protein